MNDTDSIHRLGRALRRFLAVPVRAQTYKNLAYLLLAFPFGLTYFVTVTVGLSLGAGLSITLIGVPLLLLTLFVATVIAGVEAQFATHLVGEPAELPEALDGIPGRGDGDDGDDGVLERLKRFLTAPTTWTSLALVGVRFVYGIVAFTALVTAGALVGGLLSSPFLYDEPGMQVRVSALPFGQLREPTGFLVDTLPEALAAAALGVLLTFVSLHALNALAKLGGLLTAALLSVRRDHDRGTAPG